MISADDIVRLYREREKRGAPDRVRMEKLMRTYEGTLVVPLPELDKQEEVSIANLITIALDQMAMRIASITPDVYFPPTVPGQSLAEKNAGLSRKAVLAWWDQSQMEIKLARRARWLIGLAMSPVTIRWDDDCGCPKWMLRNPLGTYPAETDDPDEFCPPDCVFVFRRTRAWLEQRYPEQMLTLSKGSDAMPDTLFDVLEYTSYEETVQLVLGRSPDRNQPGKFGTAPHMELDRAPNRCGCPATFVPGRVTLGRRQGMYDSMIGIYQQMAKLQALEIIAVTRGVFPNEWLVARPNEQPRVTVQANGRRGVTGVLEGGELLSNPYQPGYKTDQTINSLERYARISGGMPAEFGGESTTNVRTGRRGDAILSAVVDFPVGEAQKILARSMEYENRCAINMSKAYAGGRQMSFYVSAKGAKGRVDYVPSKNFPSSTNQVSWPAQGTDAQALIVGIGQRIGIGEMSLHTARVMDPWVSDPVEESERVAQEKLDQALLASILSQAQSGQLDAASVARIEDALVTKGVRLAEAVLQVQREKQVEQATSGAPGTPEGAVPPGSPQAQPGLGGPGAPPQAGAIGPAPNQQGLAQLLGALRTGAQSPVPAQAGAA